MPESILLLQETALPRTWAGQLPGSWKFGFARHEQGETLGWVFRCQDPEQLPKEYGESVRQRFALLGRLKNLPHVAPASLGADGEALEVFVEMPDGEPWVESLDRSAPFSEGTVPQLALDLLESLESLVPVPRLLSNVRLEDFALYFRDGVVPSLALCPALFLLRIEDPVSDFQIGKRWAEHLSRIRIHARSGRRRPFDPLRFPSGRLFRERFLGPGPEAERGLAERLHDLREPFVKASKPQSCGDAFPNGLLSNFLKSRAQSGSGEELVSPGNGPTEWESGVSSFHLKRLTGKEGETRDAYLLPPESWFERSLLGGINRRLSHPLLKGHPNAPRIRSIRCEEDYTLLLADPSEGVPLPSLVTARTGLAPAEVVIVLKKTNRAWSQFESIGAAPGIDTPWQVELHLEESADSADWGTLLKTRLESWPPWDVKLRFERPTESLLAGLTRDSWNGVARLLEGKFLPALAVWLLDWVRFQRTAREGTLDGVPMNLQPELAALFAAARDQLDPSNHEQREKFINLVAEGIDILLPA